MTWEESVKRDLKDWSITKELAMDRGAWKLAIHVPEPREILWVSPLGYPNLFGTKGFVVVNSIERGHGYLAEVYLVCIRVAQ